MKVTAILACHNRRASTLECLDSYFAQVVDDALELDAVLVDDGSTDGTGEAVRDRFPQTHVVAGSGDLFWAGGMEVAERVAVAEDPDYLLWLNDDVILDPGALTKLIQTESLGPGACIAVGALRDPATGELTYSGLRRRGLHPLRMDRVAPADEPVEIDTFNGNVVLVPHSARRKIGPIDGAMGHAAADLDYGFRAKRCGGAALPCSRHRWNLCPEQRRKAVGRSISSAQTTAPPSARSQGSASPRESAIPHPPRRARLVCLLGCTVRSRGSLECASL